MSESQIVREYQFNSQNVRDIPRDGVEPRSYRPAHLNPE